MSWHLSFTRTRHVMHPLGNFEDNYLSSIAKIQASSLVLCTDSHLHRLYLYDLSRPYTDKLLNEVSGYHRNDMSISSVDIRDIDDGDAVCADICLDPDGYNIYALIISRENKGAWIKVFTHLNRELSYTGLRYRVPMDTRPHTIVFNEVEDSIDVLGMGTHIGVPVLYNKMCYGAGIEFFQGNLYILTRRQVGVEVVTHARYNVVTEENNLHRVRLYEKRIADVQFSMLTKLNANSGECLGHYYLSVPGTENDHSNDFVFHGLTWIDGQLISQIRYDHDIIPSDLLRWHLKEAKVHIKTPEILKLKGVIHSQFGTVGEGQQLPDNMPSYVWYTDSLDDIKESIQRCVDRAHAISLISTELPTVHTQTRGQTVLVSIDTPPDNLETKPIVYPVIPYNIEHNRFPWGISMAYSLSADNSERKLYGVYGNQIWVFDILDYTLIVRHPNDNDEFVFFEGDIIDMGDVTLFNRTELQCFIRNDSPYVMKDVHLIVELDKNEDDRWKEVFLSKTQGTMGYKDLELGDIVAGGSKEFWIEIHPQDIQSWEMCTTHDLPLRVKYSTDSCDY